MSAVSDYRRQEESITLEPVEQQLERAGTAPEQELLTINLGPHHPATHGVLRLMTTLEGEVVRDLKPIVGYVHTGIEKTAEQKNYWQAITCVERMDYLSYYFNSYAFCAATEALLGLEVPKRAQYLRVIHLELNRIASHLIFFATGGLDLGAISMFWYGWRERDKVLDLFEMSSGQRMHPAYNQVGGVRDDIPAGFDRKLRIFVDSMRGSLDQYADLLARNEIVLHRLRHTGHVPRERLLELGVTGPLLRATGLPFDLRKAQPYSSYEDFDFKIPVGAVGDNYDRFAVRLEECRESLNIVEQAMAGLPEGPHNADDRKVVLPPRWELPTSMEALIHHFKLVTEGFRVPPGEVYFPIESPRGELGCFIRADGSARPARVHMRDPSFVNLQCFADMARDSYIADLIVSLAMLDPILGGIDR